MADPQKSKSASEQTESPIRVSHGASDLDESRSDREADHSDKELPEPIRPGRPMPGLPPIGLREVKDMLCSPSMPEQKIMKLVASKLTSGAYNSDDSSEGGGGGGIGMKGLFDCIIETTLCQSDHSDSDSEDDAENTPRELPCAFCSKIFVSNMRLKTHMLVMHSGEDPSLLNENHVKSRLKLQRQLSQGKSSTTGNPEARALSQGTLNVEVSQHEELVKHLPPKQRAKLSPKGKALSKDATHLSKASVKDQEPPRSADTTELTREGSQHISNEPAAEGNLSHDKSSPIRDLDDLAEEGEQMSSPASRSTRPRRRSSALRLPTPPAEMSSSSSSSSASSSSSSSSSSLSSSSQLTEKKVTRLSLRRSMPSNTKSAVSSKRRSLDPSTARPVKKSRDTRSSTSERQ